MRSLLCGVLAVFTLVFVSRAAAGPRDAQWDKVDDAVRRGLPQTAIEELEPIIQAALADHAYPEAIKAIGRKLVLEGNIQGNKPEEKIVRMQAEFDRAPKPMRPVMEAILGHWYWQYFQQNRWRFIQRTQTATPPGPDLQTWDLARILAEIDRHFTAALDDEATLKATPVGDYADLLEAGNVPDRYRPTLFDFLAYEALAFYQAGEQGAVTVEDEFELDANTSPIFADAATFTAWEPPASDALSPTRRAVRLYRKLLAFHQADQDRSAYYDADLSRLVFGHNAAVGEEKENRYQAALERFIAATDGHEVSARALALLATEVNEQGEPTKARALAQRGLDAFPESAGGAMCFNLIQQVESKSAQLKTERVWNAPWPTLDVTYRNITKVYFRAIPVDFEQYVRLSRWDFGGIHEHDRRQLLTAVAALSWSADLAPTTDFKQRTEHLPAPTSLQPGFYYIVASHDPEFNVSDNQISATAVWVSNLALVLQIHNDGRAHRGLVLHANSGEPVTGATVRLWESDREGRFNPIAPTTTDAKGRFEFWTERTQLIMLAEHDGQAIANSHPLSFYGANPEGTGLQTVFFTDRSLYRPGQTIYYKGISIRYNQPAGKYSTVARRRVTVVFNDPNGKEISRATHQTNDFGSFHGSFTAPRDRLMGSMTIRADDQSGYAWFNVEEYKRPKFQVELAAPVDAARLDGTVTLKGKANAYSGAGDRRREGEVARGARRAASPLVLVVAAARGEGHRPWHGRDGTGRHV